MTPGMLIAFEGPEGSGKSTQHTLLQAATAGLSNVVFTREPGGTELGNELRTLVLSKAYDTDAVAEFLMIAASRAQHVHEVIAPALTAGHVVITDRFSAASEVYQGYGRGLSLEFIRHVNAKATRGIEPAVTLFFDVPLAVGLARARQRAELDRFEDADVAFHERMYEGYQELAAARSWQRIDGTGTVAEVQDAVRAIVEPYLP